MPVLEECSQEPLTIEGKPQDGRAYGVYELRMLFVFIQLIGNADSLAQRKLTLASWRFFAPRLRIVIRGQ